jgi:hypothetical protein
MEAYAKQKRNVEQVSVFVLPEEKQKIIEGAEKENRSVSNFCKTKILGNIKN